MPNSFAVLAGGLDHPEGVAWDPLTERVYAGGEAGQVYAIGLDGTVTTIAVTGGFILGLAVDGRGLVYACDVGRGEVVRVDPNTGVVGPYASGAGSDRMAAPNWLAFDASGNLYVTDSGDWKKRNGRIWKVAPGGASEVWTTATKHLPNGCCVSASGDALFVVETNVPGITRLPICPDGTAGKRERWLDLPGTVPDGVAATSDGGLLVACYRPDAVLRVRPDRSVETLVEDRDGQLLGAPANVAFVGQKLDRLVTSNLGRWHVTIGDPGVRGAALPRPLLD